MDYIYFLGNASLTLRVIEYLQSTNDWPYCSMTVIHQINGWIVRVKFKQPLTPYQHGNFKAFMNEIGIPYELEIRLQMVFWSLETGQSPIDVMRRYQVAIVSHGSPDTNDIEAFRQQFTKGLGYCPETLA
ncbi:MAG: hypothetical protein KPI85_01770 [cyanobacterium endosymbiont of Epithemia adnata isolate EadnSB Bon19]|jgi:hypothetical protein|uniref:hypothetical protein n=1 Tax=cyanobacterium endosymbiont of Epithemia turgida TaxID=718217 RepID=UPI0004D10353|nr:hypothetical protein [cyanobacterium endosymbiont of Epithemia turgida]BAP18161.1 hypothetical protein ETSB_1417 [cyanobacterium endosymbiont of Epithemia turgida isolate EtSB Lake Yunoko]